MIFIRLSKFIFVVILVTLFFRVEASADDLAISCGTTHDCGDVGKDIGYAATAIGAVILPHYFIDKQYTGNFNMLNVGAGTKNYKNMYLFLVSQIRPSFSAALTTDFDLQLYDASLPFALKYGIGTGNPFFLYEYFYIFPILKLALAKIEKVEHFYFGPEFQILFHYALNDKISFDFLGQSIFYPDLVLKSSLGFSYSDISYSAGFEDNSLLKTKIIFLSLGYRF